MKHEKIIPVLVLTLLLTACGVTGISFSTDTYGECFAAETAVFCVDTDEISAYDLNGKKLFSEKHCVAEPMYDTAGSYALIYGENDIYLSNGKEIRHNAINNRIMSTTINPDGHIVLCAEEAGYKGSATVFDENFTPLYKWYSASGYIIKAALSEKNTLAVLTANEKGSTAHIFNLDSEEEQYSVFLEKNLAIDFGWIDEKLCILTETAAYFADEDGVEETFTFDRRLGEYAIGNKSLVAEMQNGDGTGELLSININGKKTGSAECEAIRRLAAGDGCFAVICGSDAVLYGENLKEICRADARGVRNVMLCGEEMLLLRDCDISAVKQ